MWRCRNLAIFLSVTLCLIQSGCLIQPGLRAEFAAPLNQGEKDLTDHEIQRGLSTLRELAKDKGKYDDYARSLGFTSAEEALTATPGKLLRVYQVSLSALKNFQQSTEAEKILDEKPSTVLVPILANGAIRSSLANRTIRSSFMIAEFESEKQWRIIGQGSSNILKHTTPTDLARLDAVVMIPDLRLRFFARRSNGQIMLIPIKDYPLFNLKGGVEYPSKEVFTNLQPVADRVARALADSPEEDNRPNRSSSLNAP